MTPSTAEIIGIDSDPTEAPEPGVPPVLEPELSLPDSGTPPAPGLAGEDPVKVSQDGRLVVVSLAEDASFEALRDGLARRLPPLTDAQRRRVRLELGERPLDAFDVRRWIHHLSEHCTSDVVGLRCSEAALLAYATCSLKVPVDFVAEDASMLPGQPELEVASEGEEDSDTEAFHLSPDAPTEPGVSMASPEVDPADVGEAVPDDVSDVERDSGDTPEGEATLPEDPAALPDEAGELEAVPTMAIRRAEAEQPSPMDRISRVLGAVRTAVRGDELHAPPEPAPGPARRPSAPERLSNAEGGRKVVVVDRNLRSGASIKSPGDIVVYGDVNSGAELKAEGHIVVLGRLRGLAHAGCGGDEAAQVIALDLDPPQLRIAHRIAYAPERSARGKGSDWAPEVAFIDGDHIVFENYRRR